tara:strand:+ start:1455 stop:2201 length:747 start_codon:yes stop_codon:yes gene_type:complete
MSNDDWAKNFWEKAFLNTVGELIDKSPYNKHYAYENSYVYVSTRAAARRDEAKRKMTDDLTYIVNADLFENARNRATNWDDDDYVEEEIKGFVKGVAKIILPAYISAAAKAKQDARAPRDDDGGGDDSGGDDDASAASDDSSAGESSDGGERASAGARENLQVKQWIPTVKIDQWRTWVKTFSPDLESAVGGKRKRRTRRNKKYNKKSNKHHKKRSYKKGAARRKRRTRKGHKKSRNIRKHRHTQNRR